MYCRSTSQHQTMWPSMKHWSMASSWQRRLAFGGFYVTEILISWCSNALAIGMQRMQTWRATNSLCNSCRVSLKGVSSITSPELIMKQRMHYPTWDPPEEKFHPAYP